ncbi:MAG: hypothetical protein ACTSRA_05970 [Promethearchaeota archaeon]
MEKEIKKNLAIKEPDISKGKIKSHVKELESYKLDLQKTVDELEFIQKIEAFIERVMSIKLFDADEEQETVQQATQPEEQEVKTIEPEAIKKELSEEEELYVALCKEHEWLDKTRYAFMYNAPPKKDKNYKEWKEEWSKILFDYSDLSKKHILYIQELINQAPFSKLRAREKNIIEIANTIVKKKLAKWLKKKKILRVYWRSIEEWADQIYKWAQENLLTDPQFIYNLKESGEDFSDLPDDDFIHIFKVIVKKKKGRIVKTKDRKIAIVFDLLA